MIFSGRYGFSRIRLALGSLADEDESQRPEDQLENAEHAHAGVKTQEAAYSESESKLRLTTDFSLTQR